MSLQNPTRKAAGLSICCAIGILSCHGIDEPLLFGRSVEGVAGAAVSSGASDGGGSSAGGSGRAAGGAGGTPPLVHSPLKVSSTFLGQWATCAFAAEDDLPLCWGANEGRLGVGDTVERLSPTRVLADAPLSLISHTGSHACAIVKSSKQVQCWGQNELGQLGTGDAQTHLAPTTVGLPNTARHVAAGTNHSCAVLIDGTLWCWGSNLEGQLGQGTNQNSFTDPLQVGSDEDWLMVDAHSGHTCGLRGTGGNKTIWCWGRNTDAQIGQGATTPLQHRVPIQVAGEANWVKLDLSQTASCALELSGQLWCWGKDVEGALRRSGEVLLNPLRIDDRLWDDFAVGTFHSCAIRSGELWCWGRNRGGQLGQGDLEPHDGAVRTGFKTNWTQVAVGRFHTCAIDKTRSLYCFGNNERGQLGVGDKMNRLSPELVLRMPGASE